MKIKLIIILVAISCFAQSVVIPEPRVEYYRDVYLPKLKISKADIDIMKEDYLQKVKKILADNDKNPKEPKSEKYKEQTSKRYIYPELFNNRVNVNAYDKFKEVGVDCLYSLFAVGRRDIENNINDFASWYFSSAVILVATVNESFVTKSKPRKTKPYGVEKDFQIYYMNYKLQIDEVIKGNYLLEKFPDTINLKGDYGFDDYELADQNMYGSSPDEIELVKIFKKVLYPVELNVGDTVVFRLLPNYTKDNYGEFFKEETMNMISRNIIYQGYLDIFGAPEKLNNIDKVISFMKELEKINDTPNFLNKTYK